MDPALYAATKAAALAVCRQVAALGMPFAEALAEVEEGLSEEPGDDSLRALAFTVESVSTCVRIGEELGPAPAPPYHKHETTEAALRLCGVIAAANLPVDEALADIHARLASHPDHGGFQVLQRVFQSLAELAAIGRLATEGIPFRVVPEPVAVVAEPAPGAVVALLGGLHG